MAMTMQIAVFWDVMPCSLAIDIILAECATLVFTFKICTFKMEAACFVDALDIY